MKNVKKLLIFLTISTFVFASWTRTDALGGNAGYWADDYANIKNFPASVNDHSVAYTNGMNFTTIFDHDGTTWGFEGGTGNDDVVNMYWGNGTMGASFGLSMSPETDAEEAVTAYDIGFGMPLAGGDFGFTYDDSGTIGINHRRAQSVWVWDNMLVNVGMTPEDTDAGTDSKTAFSVDCYTNRAYEGGTSGLFALGFHYGAVGEADATMNLVWTFAVESAMTDWATLRVGYNKSHDFGGGANNGGAVTMGLGFNYGSFSLDMALNTATTTKLFNDPVVYMTGRNSDALGAGWTISYNW